MNTDQILRKILSDEELKKFWPEIKNPEIQTLNTILRENNIYLKFLHTVLLDGTNENVRKNIVSKLLG